MLFAGLQRPCAAPGCRAHRPRTPMMRPATERLCSSRVAKKAACGPPKPIGMPKRCDEPSAMSAPISPGDLSRTSAIRSEATAVTPPRDLTAAIGPERSVISPASLGYWKRAPKTSSSPASCGVPKTSSKPKNPERVFSTSMLCGSRRHRRRSDWTSTCSRAAPWSWPSAAAVASSSSEALASSRPVRSITIC